MSETKKQLAEKFVDNHANLIKKELQVESFNKKQVVEIVEKILLEQYTTITDYEFLCPRAYNILALIPVYMDYQKVDKTKADDMRDAAAILANMQKTPEINGVLMSDHFLDNSI